MKSIFLTTVVWLMTVGLQSVAVAELEHQTAPILSAGAPKKVPTNRNTGPSIAGSGIKDVQFNKARLLRCWQYGQLIVAENGWQNPGANGTTLLTRGQERMTGFDFGETFCLYISN